MALLSLVGPTLRQIPILATVESSDFFVKLFSMFCVVAMGEWSHRPGRETASRMALSHWMISVSLLCLAMLLPAVESNTTGSNADKAPFFTPEQHAAYDRDGYCG
jgi:hypothetical protein